MRSGSLSGAVTLPGKSIGVLLLVFVSIGFWIGDFSPTCGDNLAVYKEKFNGSSLRFLSSKDFSACYSSPALC